MADNKGVTADEGKNEEHEVSDGQEAAPPEKGEASHKLGGNGAAKRRPGRPKREGEECKTTSVALPVSVLGDLQELAAIGDRTFTALLADICRKYVGENKDILRDYRKTKEKLAQRMSAAAKAGQNE